MTREAPDVIAKRVQHELREIQAFVAETGHPTWLRVNKSLGEIHDLIGTGGDHEFCREQFNALSQQIDMLNADQLPCHHPTSLLQKSVESDYTYCDLCETRDRLRDAVRMEAYYKADAIKHRELLRRVQQYPVGHQAHCDPRIGPDCVCGLYDVDVELQGVK